MPEPVSSLIAAAALGSVAGKAVERAWDAGERWISTYLAGHGETVRARAEANTLEFLGDLAQRVRQIEEAYLETGREEELHETLSDPDFAATLQLALVASARTSDSERHELLADLVASRLSTSPGSQQALSASIAVEAIPRMLPKHLDLLGCIVVVSRLDPVIASGNVRIGELPVEITIEWLTDNLSRYDLETDIGRMDLYHLDSVGCLSYLPIAGIDLKDHVGRLAGTAPETQVALQADPRYRALEEMWKRRGLFGAQLLPPGLEIGVAVHQLRSGTRIQRQP